jgi:predicted Zn-dependent protease
MYESLNQPSREALVELLLLSLYLDEHLSLAEDEVLGQALDAIGWDSPTPRDAFLLQTFSKVRSVSTSSLESDAFLESRAATIRGADASAPALTWMTRTLAVDGISSTERWFLAKLEGLLYPQGKA